MFCAQRVESQQNSSVDYCLHKRGPVFPNERRKDRWRMDIGIDIAHNHSAGIAKFGREHLGAGIVANPEPSGFRVELDQ